MHFVRRRRLIIAIVGSAIALLVLMAVGLYGLLRGPANASRTEVPANEASVSPTLPLRIGQPQPVAGTSDPVLFARSVARALFTWDTRHESGPAAWAQVLVDAADVDEAAAVASDVRGYLPIAEMWQQLRAFGTLQWFELQSVTVPDAWSTALEQAAPGQLPRGATALTIVGTRHRAGTWNTEVTRTERQVSFTAFVACPGLDPCALLRLSQLDRPLE
ncbi:hypothetical protein ASC66_11280 [Leifsonia sp. Root4]|uniref:hypothetical protein n=1 Tax=Leifsonia sp. Root4 TaxID=1736525 RepID=UPI0006FFCC70|nr:hypothetical protein [Leifsonia sp. Root4]KQW05565.1 hypothetical protein ASC66_11280 [Leifsonia sp. Root4]